MKKGILISIMSGLLLMSFSFIGCSGENQSSLNPMSSFSQVPPNEVADNMPPFVKFDCTATSVYPGTSVMVRIQLMDAEDDQLRMSINCPDGQIVEVTEGLYQWDMPVELGIYPLCVTVWDPYQCSQCILEVEVCEQPTFNNFY